MQADVTNKETDTVRLSEDRTDYIQWIRSKVGHEKVILVFASYIR